MLKTIMLSVIFFLVGFRAQAEELRCFAGLQSDTRVNKYYQETQPQDFTISEASETSVFNKNETYTVRTYRTVLDNFVVEGRLFLDTGYAPELTITDKTTGVISHVKEQNVVRVTLSSPRNGKLTNIAAACTHL